MSTSAQHITNEDSAASQRETPQIRDISPADSVETRPVAASSKKQSRKKRGKSQASSNSGSKSPVSLYSDSTNDVPLSPVSQHSAPASPTASRSSQIKEEAVLGRCASAPPRPQSEHDDDDFKCYYSPFKTGLHVQLPVMPPPQQHQLQQEHILCYGRHEYHKHNSNYTKCNFADRCDSSHQHQQPLRINTVDVNRKQQQQQQYEYLYYNNNNNNQNDAMKSSVRNRNTAPSTINSFQNQQPEFSLFDKRMSALFGRSPR